MTEEVRAVNLTKQISTNVVTMMAVIAKGSGQ
ncbi:hypothetical protein V3C99_019131 [Haemonchus contortus]